MFLFIVVGQNTKKSITKKNHFLISYDVILKHIYAKNVLKNENIFPKQLMINSNQILV